MPAAKGSSVPSTGRGRDETAGEEPRAADDTTTGRAPPPPPGGGPDRQGQADADGFLRPGVVNVKLIYSAYLLAIALPVTALFGAFFAYQAQRKSPPAWLMTHYVYQMRTFWIGLGANVVAWLLTFAGIGLVLLPVIAVWVVARAVHGLIRVAQGLPIDNPDTLII